MDIVKGNDNTANIFENKPASNEKSNINNRPARYNANYRRTFDRFLASRQIELTPSLEISDTSFIIKMLERSSGISLLPRFAVAEPASRGDLRILEVSDFRLTMYRQMFYHKDKCCTREMDAFIQLASGPDLPLL